MGNSPYVDYEVSDSKTWLAEEQLRYLPGMGTQADLTIDANGYPDEATYYHGDLIGSTMLLTDGVGQTVNTAAYTAFGEYIAPSGTIGGDLPSDFSRYGYAGAHGYESGLMTLQGANTNLPPITLQHLGERWYQPGLGRFIQRDPIGILGGMNVYGYCTNGPTIAIDPSGLTSMYHPAAFVELIAIQLMNSSTVNICVQGTVYVVVGIRRSGGQAVALILKNGGEFLVSQLPKVIDATQTPSGGFVVHNPPKACGATGLEVAPLLVWMYLQQRRRSTRRQATHERVSKRSRCSIRET